MKATFQLTRLLLQKPKSLYQLIAEQDSDLQAFSQALNQLSEEEKIGLKDGKFFLTEKGRQFALASQLSFQAFSTEMAEIKETYFAIAEKRSLPLDDFYQGFNRFEDLMKRVEFMHAQGDLDGKKILVLGDDDLLSILIALTGKAKLAVAADIDERLLQLIEEAARQFNLNIETIHYNVESALPEELKAGFDVVSTEPPEALEGLKCFMSRCAESLKGKGSAIYFGLTHLEASVQKWHAVQATFLDMGFALTHIKKTSPLTKRFTSPKNQARKQGKTKPSTRKWLSGLT